jgi:hypothetical protein
MQREARDAAETAAQALMPLRCELRFVEGSKESLGQAFPLEEVFEQPVAAVDFIQIRASTRDSFFNS